MEITCFNEQHITHTSHTHSFNACLLSNTQPKNFLFSETTSKLKLKLISLQNKTTFFSTHFFSSLSSSHLSFHSMPKNSCDAIITTKMNEYNRSINSAMCENYQSEKNYSLTRNTQIFQNFSANAGKENCIT